MSLRAAVLAFTLVVVPPSAFAANLLPNPNFDSDLSGWDGSDGKTWSSKDAGGAASGSFEVFFEEVGTDAITRCVPVDGGAGYDLRVSVLIENQNNGQGRGGLVVRWMSDEACTTQIGAFPDSLFETFAPSWKPRLSSVQAPDDAVAALVEVRASKTSGNSGAKITVNLDDVFFGPLEGAAGCADPLPPYASTTASDALHVLKASVASVSCDAWICDANGSGDVSASDALAVLRIAVGFDIPKSCPAC